MRTETLALTACMAALLAALAGCSSGDRGRPAAKSIPPEAGAVGYLYTIDNYRRSHADVEKLVKQLYARCTDDVQEVEFAAAKTATDLVDAQHDHQDVYPVLAQLVADFPKGDGKQRCATGLGAVAKRLKAQRAQPLPESLPPEFRLPQGP